MVRTKPPTKKPNKKGPYSDKKARSTSKKYFPERCEQAHKLAKLGLTEKRMAEVMLINVGTLESWERNYPEFKEAIRLGRIEADANVAESLYQKAVGYQHPETIVHCYKGKIIKTTVIKHYPPDTGAAAFWLKNRTRAFDQPWTDVIKHEVGGKNGGAIDVRHLLDVDISDLSDEEIQLGIKLGMKLQTKTDQTTQEEK